MWDRIDRHNPDVEVPQHIPYAVGLENVMLQLVKLEVLDSSVGVLNN